MRISIFSSGSFDKTVAQLQKMQKVDTIAAVAAAQAARGVAALSAATPKDSGKAASSWRSRITRTANSIAIEWYNTDIENGFAVALKIQHGHGTGTGGYVPGKDYINPAMRPVFAQIAASVWKAVISA